jgi:hypothetical protein
MALKYFIVGTPATETIIKQEKGPAMKRIIQWIVLIGVLLSPSAFACSDQETEQCIGPICACVFDPSKVVRSGTDPECRGDLCRFQRDLGREIGRTPQAVQECVENISLCANQVVSAPLATPVKAYLDGLYRQAEGRVKPLPSDFVRLTQPYYDIDLSRITFAENINTGHGMNLAYCDRIFFIESIDPFNNKSDLTLILHEMEHLVQCQKRGRDAFLAEYILKGATEVVKNQRINIHDLHDFEIAADNKANSLADTIWNNMQARDNSSSNHPPPIVKPTNVFPSGTLMQPCGCTGFTSQTEAQEPKCTSGGVVLQVCPGMCAAGGHPYGYVCR